MAAPKKSVAATKKPRPRTTRVKTKKQLKRPFFAAHRHSFKLLPHRHTSYPMLAFLLLLVGVFTGGWTAVASGDDYVVNAVVPAQPLTQPATIISPHDGDVVHSSPIIVNGTCPVGSYVNLYRNDVFSGVGLCQNDGTWHIQTSLTAGANKLEAKDFNVTNQPGPASSPITITYVPPSSSSTSSGTNSSGAKNKGSGTPLVVSSNYIYQGFFAEQLASEQVTISGGTAPYAVSVDWGDGSSDLSSKTGAGQFSITHRYAKPGGYGHSYVIIVKVTDAAGQSSLLQLLVIITPTQTGTGPSSLNRLPPSGQTPSPYQTFWRIVGPTYLIALVALSSFWLGERREFELLRSHGRLSTKRLRHS